jgi:hypothetical protein
LGEASSIPAPSWAGLLRGGPPTALLSRRRPADPRSTYLQTGRPPDRETSGPGDLRTGRPPDRETEDPETQRRESGREIAPAVAHDPATPPRSHSGSFT